MKILLIALLCTAVALGSRHEEEGWLDSVSPNRRIEDSAFRSGREYHFFYNGQLSTGIAGSSKQHSANRIQSVVIVAFKSQNQVLMRLQNCRVGKLNRDVPNPRKIMPFEAFEDVQIEQHLKQKLERVVKFSYTGGLVHDVIFDAQEDPWSANIKRGVLNLLQVNLQQQRRLDTQEDVILTNTRSRDVRRGQEDEKSTFYRVMEQTLEGECETLYTIQQQPTNRRSNNPILNVTKSINFEKCNKRPQIKYNFRFADNCPGCESKYNNEEKFLKSSTVAKYNITGDKQAFLIEGARVDSEYVFVPFNEEANAIVTYVNQTLVLVKTGPVQGISEPQNPVESDSDMIFSLDWDVAYEKFHMKGDNQMHHKLHESQQGLNKVELAKKFVQKMAEKMKEQLDEDMLHHFTRLVQLMRMCKEDELEQIVQLQSQSTPESEKKLKNIIPQALGTCGTKSCTKLLTQKIRQGEFTQLRGAMAIKALLHNRVASQEIINELMQLVDSDKARESEHLKRTCWLTIGSLINALCTENEDKLALETKEKAEKLCPRELKDQYVKTLFNKLRQAPKWEDKVLMLKTIGNAGLDLSIFELEKIIRQQDSTTHPMYVRLEAVLALRELKDAMPKKIQRVLMPVALDRRDYPTVRQAAVYMLFQTQPERALLDQLARNLINEPSHQFASFLYTKLNAYANSTNPCEEQLSTDAKLALRQAKRVNSGLGYSGFSHFSLHTPDQKVGLNVDVGAIFSNVSAIPRHMGAALHVNGLGYWQKYLATFSLFNEGLEPLIRDYFSERGLFSMGSTNSAFDILTRHPRSVRNGQQQEQQQDENEYERELNDIFSKHLKIKHRQYNDEYENEPKAYFSAMFKSQTMAVAPMTKEIVQQLLREAPSKMGEWIPKLQRGLPVDFSTIVQLHDMHLKVPTTIGFPLSISLKAPMALSVRGKVQANYESKSVKVQVDLKPSAVVTFMCKVDAWTPISTSGVKLQAKAKMFAPIDAKIDIEWRTSNPQIKAVIKPPTQKRDILVLESRPITYTRSWQQYLRSVVDQSHTDEITIVGEEVNRVSTYNKCYGRQTLGVDFCVRSQVQSCIEKSPAGTPFSIFAGQNKLVLTCQPSESNQDIQIKINAQSQKLNGQEIHKPSFNILGRQSPFENDDSDSSSESEETSRQHETSQERRQHQQRHPQQQQQQQSQSQSPRRQQRPNQDPYQQSRNYEVKNGYKTDVKVEVQGGSSSKINMELSHLYDSRQRYSKLNMKMHRQHPDQFQVCLDTEMMFPEAPEFINEVKDKKIFAHAQLRWGAQSCSGQNYVQITTQAERSRQQMQWEREQSEYKQYNQKEQCRNNKGWCSPLTQEDFVEKIGHMLKYRMDIDYQNVPLSLQNATNKLYRALKHYYFWQTDVDQINVQNQEGKIRAELVLDAQTKQRVNVTIKTPKENILIQDLPLSQPIMALNQKQSFSEQLVDYINNEDEDDDKAQCSVTGKSGWQRRSQVETFDGTKFSAPFSDCWVVLSKDCGSQKPEFVVMARKSPKSSNNADLKEVKIVTRQHRIELSPESDEYDTIKVKVNGKSYDPENEQDVVHHGHVVAKIDKEGKSINVDLPETGVQIDFDGYAINVQLSQYYQGQQCGLCGHYDQEEADEFRNPDFTQEEDLRQYYMNYLIKDGRCQAPSQLNQICQDQDCDQDKSSSSSSSSSSDEDDNDNDDTTEKPDHKTKVIEMDDQICFSTIPVPQCDDNSYPTEIKERKQVPYTCIDQDSESAEQYERKARFGKKAIQGLTSRQPNFTRTESIPEKCKKYKS
jgi:hypothetical protein